MSRLSCTGRRARLLLVAAASLVGVAVAVSDEEVRRPAWLVGRWEHRLAEGRAEYVFAPDGAFEFRLDADTGQKGDFAGSWRDEGGRLRLAASDGSTEVFALERLPTQAGVERIRIRTPGDADAAPVFSRVPHTMSARPDFAVGTWVVRGPNGTVRVVLFRGGKGRRSVGIGATSTETIDAWRFEGGALVLGGERIDLTFLAPDGERLRARWSFAGRPATFDFTRESWPRALAAGETLVSGRWRRRDGQFPVVWTFAPDGTAERRRRIGYGTAVERGTFELVKGATGSGITFESEAGRRIRRVVERDGEAMTWRDEETGRTETFDRVAGSVEAVRAEAIDAATERADLLLSNEAFYGGRARVPSRASDASPGTRPERAHRAPVEIAAPDDSDSVPDPDPDDVIPGAEVLRATTIFAGESEAVGVRLLSEDATADADDPAVAGRAKPKSARPREEEIVTFLPTGRVQLVRTRFGADGTAEERSSVRYGRYSLTGAVATIEVPGEPPISARLADGSTRLYVGERVFVEMQTRLGTPVEPSAR